MNTLNPTTATIAEVVALAKAEIIEDVQAGDVPATVRSFSDLHEFVDANEYGGGCEFVMDWDAGPADEDGDRPESTGKSEAMQNEVNAWLAAGGLAEATADQTPLTANLPADLVTYLREAAEEEGQSVDSLVRGMVEIYLDGRA